MTVPSPEPIVPPVPTPPAVPPVPTLPADATAPPAKPETDWKAEARKHEARAKENKAAADELAALKAANQTEAEKAVARATAAEQRNVDLVNRTVRAEVKVAAEAFETPADAHLYLDLKKYVDAEGEIDTAAIATDLAEVLESRPNLKKAAGPRVPKPDPSQGARPEGNPDLDTQIAAATAAGNHPLAIRLMRQKAYAATT